MHREKLFNPLVVVVSSVAISIVIYLGIASVYTMKEFRLGLILSTVIPAAVSFPISFVMIRYHKKIRKQKDELQR